MRACRIRIENFRGIRTASLLLPKHAVLIGDNNTGKTTILEALDLVLGPDRLNRQAPIDEHDFYQGRYVVSPAVASEGEAVEVVAAQASEQENAPRAWLSKCRIAFFDLNQRKQSAETVYCRKTPRAEWATVAAGGRRVRARFR